MDHDHHPTPRPTSDGAETSKDRSAGLTVAVKPDGATLAFGDETFHFCSEKCPDEIQKKTRGSMQPAEAQSAKGGPCGRPVYLPDAPESSATRRWPADLRHGAGTDGFLG